MFDEALIVQASYDGKQWFDAREKGLEEIMVYPVDMPELIKSGGYGDTSYLQDALNGITHVRMKRKE